MRDMVGFINEVLEVLQIGLLAELLRVENDTAESRRRARRGNWSWSWLGLGSHQNRLFRVLLFSGMS